MAYGGSSDEMVGMKVLIRMRCRDLKSFDMTSESDPMVVMSMRKGSGDSSAWAEIGRTERLDNQKDAAFSTTFTVDYLFEEIQQVKFAVYDADGTSASMEEHDLVGECTGTLGEIVGASSGSWESPLKGESGKTHGIMHVDAEEASTANGVATFQFRGTKLDKKDFFGKSDPYIEIKIQNARGEYENVVYKSAHLMNTLNPVWPAFTISLTELCNGDTTRPIKLFCWDWDSDGSNDMIGYTEDLTVDALVAGYAAGKEFDLINPKKLPGGKKAKKGYKNSGTLQLMSASVVNPVGFVEHLQRGLMINFSVGIDFTGSNGDPTQPTSLHYMNPYQPNEYVQAIQAVGTIIQDYDADKLFPSLGYGAKLADGSVSHCFSLTGNEANPFCSGVNGIVEAYKGCFARGVKLWGPTNFAPIIKQTIDFAKAAHDDPNHKGAVYYVQLIVTDGAITDMGATKDMIVASSHLPMSIIIVGVGAADFSKMVELDGDGDAGLKDSRGQSAERDVVQFVPFRNFAGNPAQLAKEVLREVPGQVCEYMTKHGK